MKFTSVLIVTYGRSGSTLLQGILNSIDDCVIKGENYQFCYGLFQSWQALKKTQQQADNQTSLTTLSPWFGADSWNETLFFIDARRLLLNQLYPEYGQNLPACTGFKEIRYLNLALQGEVLLEYLDFLAQLLPNSAFIHLTRDHHAVANSAWWQQETYESVHEKLTTLERLWQNYAQQHPEATFSLDYTDLNIASTRLQALFAFLGATWQPARLAQVLQTPHSYKATTKLLDNLHSVVHSFFLDQDLLFKASQVCVLRGALVLYAADLQANSCLVMEIAGKTQVLEWFLPSPVLSNKYPDLQQATNARFRSTSFIPVQGEQLNLYLQTPSANYLLTSICIA